MKTFIASALLILLSYLPSAAQCTSPPNINFCTGGSAPSNGQNINSGQTYVYTGNPAVSTINLNGGTLHVCGNLTLSSLNFNGGTIIIAPDAQLTINGGGTLHMNGNSYIYNFGTLNMNRSITMQNSNNMVMNATPSSVLNMSSYTLELNSGSSYFVNNGSAQMTGLNIQSNAPSGGVCLGTSSRLNTTNLMNNRTGGINAPSGTGCLSFTGNALINNSVTTTPDVYICRGASATTSGGGNWGSATVSYPCGDCSNGTVLPIELLSFEVNAEDAYARITWITASETNNERFELERSEDAQNWQIVHSESGAGNSNQLIQYDWIDQHIIAGQTYYYRLKQIDFNQEYSISPIIPFYSENNSLSVSVYPNPFGQEFYILNPDDEPLSFAVHNSLGQLVLSETRVSGQRIRIELPVKEPGVYFLNVIKGNKSSAFKVIRSGNS